MTTTAVITKKCAELSRQIQHQTELMRRLAAATATQATGSRAQATAQDHLTPDARRRPAAGMGEVRGPAATPDAEMSSADMLQMYGLATVAARDWLPGEQRSER
jgi:predicted amidophosphoribosyltransferase